MIEVIFGVVVLAVLNYLDAVVLIILQIFNLNGLRELSLPQDSQHLVPGSKHLIDYNRQLSLLLEPCLLSIVDNFKIVAVIGDTVMLQRIYVLFVLPLEDSFWR